MSEYQIHSNEFHRNTEQLLNAELSSYRIPDNLVENTSAILGPNFFLAPPPPYLLSIPHAAPSPSPSLPHPFLEAVRARACVTAALQRRWRRSRHSLSSSHSHSSSFFLEPLFLLPSLFPRPPSQSVHISRNAIKTSALNNE